MSQDRLEEAQAAMIAARKLKPDDVRVWLNLVKLMLRNQKPENVGRLLDLAEKEVGSPVLPLRLERIQQVVRDGGDSAAEKLANIEQGVDSLPEPQRASVMLQLGSAYLQLRIMTQRSVAGSTSSIMTRRTRKSARSCSRSCRTPRTMTACKRS